MVLNNKSIFEIFRVCVNRTGVKKSKEQCSEDAIVKFNRDEIPPVIQEVIIYLSRSCVAIGDLFRRSGNTVLVTNSLRYAQRQLETLRMQNNSQDSITVDDANPVPESETALDWRSCNAYTLANIVKRYLLQIDEGIFGKESEEKLMESLQLEDDQIRIECMSGIISSLPLNTRRLLALLFGTWFRMIYHSDVNAMSVEAVAKSVAGSVLPSCTTNPMMVEKASSIMQQLIKGFPSAELFGKDLIQYYTSTTGTSISRIEKYRYEFIFPKNVSRKKSTRLFVRMLLEEAVKHEFDIERDEVGKDEFDLINTSVTIDDVNNNTQSNTNSSSILAQPYLIYRYQPSVDERFSSEEQDTEFMFATDEVQQTLEKRTCVMALGKRQDEEIDDSQSFESREDNREILWQKMDDQIKEQLRVHRKNQLALLKDSSSENTPSSTPLETTPVHEPPSTNSNNIQDVMRQRLQKRSDWFLSPPSGCANTKLIQLSPASDADTENTPPSPSQVPILLNRNEYSDSFLHEIDDDIPPTEDIAPIEDESVVRYFVIRKIYGPEDYKTVSIARL